MKTIFRGLLAALFLAAPAAAQAPIYPSVQVQTQTPGTADNRAASTAFVGAAINSRIVDARDYGSCIWDGASSHDVAPCINAAITAVGAGGGGKITLPAGVFSVSSTILMNQTAVTLLGKGHGYNTPATTLKWTGGPGGLMMQLGKDHTTGVFGSVVQGILLDCNASDATLGRARRGIYALNFWYFDVDVFVREPYSNAAASSPQAVAIEMADNVNFGNWSGGWQLQASTKPAGAALAPLNTYTQLSYPCGLWIHGGLNLANGNSAAIQFYIIATQTVGVPIQVDWSDHHIFRNVTLFTGGAYPANPNLLGPGMYFNNAAAATGAFTDAASNGHSIGEYGSNSTVWTGAGSTGITPPAGLIIEKIGTFNTTPPPVIGAGSGVTWRDDFGTWHGFLAVDGVFTGLLQSGSMLTGVLTANTSIMTPGNLQVGWLGRISDTQIYAPSGVGYGSSLLLAPNAKNAWQLGVQGSIAGVPDFAISRFANADGSYQGNPLSISNATGLVSLANGLAFGSVGSSPIDLSKHVSLFPGYGLNVSSGRINMVAASGSIVDSIGGNDIFTRSGLAASLSVPLTVAGGIIAPAYTSVSIGGSSLTAGTCASTTVAITGLTTAHVVDATPATYPGDPFFWKAYASSAGTATVKVCAAVTGTPTASAYNLRVIQ